MVTVAFKELWETRQFYKDKYLKQTEALVNKKRDLWTLENVAKWGIKDQQFVSQNIEHLTSDFEFASQYMMENETKDTVRLQNVFTFLTNQVHSEILKALNSETQPLNQTFLKLAQKMIGRSEELPNYWLKILNK